MELLEGDALRKRILKSYAKNPKDWNFTISPSPGSGFYDAMVSGPDGAWMLKIDSLFKPYPIVLGSPAELGQSRQETPFTYGYRNLSPKLALQMFGAEGSAPRNKTLATIMRVLRSEPVVPEEGRSYAEGPFILTKSRTFNESERQKEINDRLTFEMRRLLKIRYPAYG
jgi:hypothetical protein